MPSSYWECAQFAMGASLLSPAQGSLRAPLLEWGARPARLGAMPPRAKGAAARSRSGPPRAGAQQWRETTQEQRDAGAELMKKFLELFATTKLSAKVLCTLSWLCDRAQVPGAPFGLYALHPSSDSGNFSRHIDKVLPDSGELYQVKAPMNLKTSTVRSVVSHTTRVLWSSIQYEVESDNSINELLCQPCDDREANGTGVLVRLPNYVCH